MALNRKLPDLGAEEAIKILNITKQGQLYGNVYGNESGERFTTNQHIELLKLFQAVAKAITNDSLWENTARRSNQKARLIDKFYDRLKKADLNDPNSVQAQLIACIDLAKKKKADFHSNPPKYQIFLLANAFEKLEQCHLLASTFSGTTASIPPQITSTSSSSSSVSATAYSPQNIQLYISAFHPSQFDLIEQQLIKLKSEPLLYKQLSDENDKKIQANLRAHIYVLELYKALQNTLNDPHFDPNDSFSGKDLEVIKHLRKYCQNVDFRNLDHLQAALSNCIHYTETLFSRNEQQSAYDKSFSTGFLIKEEIKLNPLVVALCLNILKIPVTDQQKLKSTSIALLTIIDEAYQHGWTDPTPSHYHRM